MKKLFGIIGHPVGHSMSPLMHNDAFNHLGYNGYYHAFDVQEDQLQKAVEALRVLNVAGFNVTIPHKVAIMNFLDEVDEEASVIGAVNTVVNSGGRFIGYNTDGRGYLKSLVQVVKQPLSESRVLVIGAGGAARGVVTALVNHGIADLSMTNRTTQKAIEIKNNILQYKKCSLDIVSLQEAEKNVASYDVIINTTSIGMSPKITDIPLPVTNLKKGVILSDLIYNPLKTRWLQLGEEQGASIHNGVGMFVEQGALAFEKWTGLVPDKERMTNIVLKHLGGKTC